MPNFSEFYVSNNATHDISSVQSNNIHITCIVKSTTGHILDQDYKVYVAVYLDNTIRSISIPHMMKLTKHTMGEYVE